MATVEQKTLKIISKIIGKSVKINDSMDSLNADSLDEFEIIITLEDDFDISIDDNEISQLKTVKDYVDIVANKVKGV